MNTAVITPVILSFNEEANLERALLPLSWARRIVLVDSLSADQTLNIAAQFPQVQVYRRPFDTHQLQWNFGLDQVDTEWVLSLDADYVLTEELAKEIQSLPENPDVNGYFIPFRFCVDGTPLSASILPPRVSLFRRAHARYSQDGHTQRLELEGPSGRLANCIHHDDRKPLSRWLQAQDRYAQLEAQKLQSSHWNQLSFQDRLRKMVVLAPWVVLFYALIVKGLFRDGWRGWHYVLQRTLAELVLSLHLIASRFRSVEGGSATGKPNL